MLYNFIYGAIIHGKAKPGVCDEVKPRFKGYNKGNFKHIPAFLYIVGEGHEEQTSIIEAKVKTQLYDYLENPNFHNQPTEYVDPKFAHVDLSYIEDVIQKIITDNNLCFYKVKEEYLKDSLKDAKFSEKIRMFPDKYLDKPVIDKKRKK